jgi:hypothetical protein
LISIVAIARKGSKKVVAIKPEYLLELLFSIVPTAIKWIKGK